LQASKRAKAIRDEERARAEFQALQSEAQAGMQKMQRDSQAVFQSDMSAVLGELAKQRGADIVLNQDTSVIWAHSGMDWTNDVVERLNARHAP
jgi:Skp family chaperone for outer membrane proteins